MKTKRFLSIVLTLAMLVGMFPGMSLTASAAGNTTEITPTNTSGTMMITLTIKAAQTITASDVTATYGDTDKSVTASVTTPATGGGAISYTVKDGSGDYIDVASDGKLTIKKVPASGKAYVIVKAAETDDYAETTKEVTVTISKAEATVAAKDQGIMVGGTVPDLSAPVLNTHYSVTGLVGTDTLTTAPTLDYQKDGNAATPDNTTAGTYDIVPSGASAGDNYNISYTNGTLTITAKDAQTITASDVTATYGETDKSVSATTDGNGEISYAVKAGSEDYISVASDGKLTIKKVPADGKAYVTVTASETNTGGTDGNGYAAATKDVTVNISKATVTITAKNQSIYVGGTVPTLSGADFYTASGLVGEDVLTTNPTLAYQNNGSAATPDNTTAGTYDIVPSGASAGDNYNISYTNGTLTISEKPTATVTKAPEAKTLTYTGSAQSLVTAGSAEGGEMQYALGTETEATQPYTTSIPTKTDAGTYYVWYMVKGDDNHNNTDPARVKDAISINPVDKTELNAAIASAEAYYDSIKDNAAYADIAATLKKAIDAAKAVAGNDNATKDAVAEMVSEVGNAASKAKDDVAAVDKKAAEEEAAKKAAEEEAAKQAADEAAAKAVTDAINALPENAGAGDKAAVEAARRAYDALTEDQKKLVPDDALSKLAAAEQQVAAAGEAAETVKISACKIRVKSLAYTGKRIKKPTVTVTYKGQKLKEGTDYTFTYNKKAKAIGAYRVTVKGKGRFTGSKKVTLKVVPKGTVFSKVAGGDKLVFLKWKSRRNITGYQIEYSLKKDFSDRKRVTIKKAKAPAKTPTKIIKKLKAGKTYYVRIRTYTTVKKKNYFSAWSKAKAVKTRAGRAGNESVEPEDETGIDAGDLSLEIDEISIDEISIDEIIPGDGGTVDDGEVTVDEAVEVTVE